MDKPIRRRGAAAEPPPTHDVFHACFFNPRGVLEETCEKMTHTFVHNCAGCCTFLDEGTIGCKSKKRVCAVCLLTGPADQAGLVADFGTGLCESHKDQGMNKPQPHAKERKPLGATSGMHLHAKPAPPQKSPKAVPEDVPVSVKKPKAETKKKNLVQPSNILPLTILPDWKAVIDRYRAAWKRKDAAAPSHFEISDVIVAMRKSGMKHKEIGDLFRGNGRTYAPSEKTSFEVWSCQVFKLAHIVPEVREYLAKLNPKKMSVYQLTKVSNVPPQRQRALVDTLFKK